MVVLITFPLSETVSVHAPDHVIFNPGKIVHIFWNYWLKFVYSLCHFDVAATKIKPCWRRKIAFPHCDNYAVYCLCAVSRDLCIEIPSKVTRNNCFTPNNLFTIQRLLGYDDD